MRNIGIRSLCVSLLTLVASGFPAWPSWLGGSPSENESTFVIATPGYCTLGIQRPEVEFVVEKSAIASPEKTTETNKRVSITPILSAGDAAGILNIRREADSLVIEWTGGGTLQSSDDLAGPWEDVGNAESPFRTPMSGSHRFFRIERLAEP